MTSVQVKQYLESFINYELNLDRVHQRTFKLKRVEKLLSLLGNPQKKLKVIHIAGTKGKGSSCVYTATVLAHAGYKVGLYTSPHLSDFKERIRILKPYEKSRYSDGGFGGKITKGQLITILSEIKDVLERLRVDEKLGRLSYFEVMTVLAICHFCQNKVDFAVLETGLGGRLDATNIVDSLVCAITPISLDHTKQLGKTIRAIAQEKAAIIKKKNQCVVIAPQKKAAEVVIRKRIQTYKAQALWVGKDIEFKVISQKPGDLIFSMRTNQQDYGCFQTRLLGDYQCLNAALCVGIIESIRREGFEVSDQAIRQGIAATVWPGRFEILKKDPYVILDGAHNPSSAKALMKTVQGLFPHKKIRLVLGMSQDKDQFGIARCFHKMVSTIFFTKANNPRASVLNKEKVYKLFPLQEVVVTETVKEALRKALYRIHRDDVVLVTGSLFVVGEARECWKELFFLE